MRYYSGDSIYKFAGWNSLEGEMKLEPVEDKKTLILSKGNTRINFGTRRIAS